MSELKFIWLEAQLHSLACSELVEVESLRLA